MAEIWEAKEAQVVATKDTEAIYEIKDTVTVRTVSKTRLEREKTQYQEEIARFNERIAKIDADLAQIVTLEKDA